LAFPVAPLAFSRECRLSLNDQRSFGPISIDPLLPLAGGAAMRSVRFHKLVIPVISSTMLVALAILAPAQDLNPPLNAGQNLKAGFDQIVGQPKGLPQLPPQGAWGEVINVTSRWIVIQNHVGQQFPIRVSDIGDSFVRWRASFDNLTNRSVVEAYGFDLGSNVVQTPHVDVFEGSDRNLVQPVYASVVPENALLAWINPGFNRFQTAYDFVGQYQLYGWAFPPTPVMDPSPARLHVVGEVVQRVPLQIAAPGNIVATVAPDPGEQLTISQVTRGSMQFIRKGDYVFITPSDINPRGLVVSQMILYKNITYPEFLLSR
jgi:hypothetical protein